MIIKLNDLKIICSIIIDKAIDSGIMEINIDGDNYWIINSKEREDFNTPNPPIGIGSLQDDIQGLGRILDGSNPPTIIDFDRLANILIAAGEEISKSDKIY